MNPNEPGVTQISSELRAKLNLETSKLGWPELQRHFARGVVVVVEKELDLIEVAATFAEDNKPQVMQWLESGRVRRASESDALSWQQGAAHFWTVVVAPWVLVQEFPVQ